jgi:hypothetical protein
MPAAPIRIAFLKIKKKPIRDALQNEYENMAAQISSTHAMSEMIG